MCVHFDSVFALQRAKRNVEAFYPVVGVLERMEDTLEVMEAVLPNLFVKGISETYTGTTLNRSDLFEQNPLFVVRILGIFVLF